MKKDTNNRIMTVTAFYKLLDSVFKGTSEKFKTEREVMKKGYPKQYKTLGLLLKTCKTPSLVLESSLIFFVCKNTEFWMKVRRIMVDREVSNDN
jgi:hypothetical protein